MKRIIISGCSGRMGAAVAACVKERGDCMVVAGFDANQQPFCDFPVFSLPGDCAVDADVIIDFSHPSFFDSMLEFALAKKLPVVVATTGLGAEQVSKIREAAGIIPVFYSGNMSLGINLLVELAKKATAVLGGQFDIEIVEKHHNQKVDAPSGTAFMLADAISETLDTSPVYVYDRHSRRGKRSKNEIGIHAVRGGNIVGEHEVIFAGRNEIITLSHSAMSREVFAAGAVNAAMFVSIKAPGLYSMKDLVD